MQALGIQEILKMHYEERLKQNPRYSMRAYSRDLKISPTQLSLILAGKKGLSLLKATSITKALKLSELQSKLFLNEVQTLYARSPHSKKIAQEELKKLKGQENAHLLSADTFRVISDWYHVGIIQTMQLSEYAHFCLKEGETAFLARALKISPNEVEEALARLKKLSIITKSSRKTFHQVIPNYLLTQENVPSRSIRKFHQQVIQKALIAMEAQALEERFLYSAFLSIDRANYPSMVEDAKNFIVSMMDKYGRDAKSTLPSNEVYSLGLQMFKVTHHHAKAKS